MSETQEVVHAPGNRIVLYGPNGRPLPGFCPDPSVPLIGITRSFSFKLNLGNYESADFFCSQRAECDPAMADEVSRDLDQFCQDEVAEAIKEFKTRRARKEAQRAERSAA